MPEIQKNDQSSSLNTASHQPPVPARKKRGPFKRFLFIAIPVFFGAIVFIGLSFLGATALEEHDNFCTSCHTVPETTYAQRADTALTSTTAPVTDLASYHYHQAQVQGQSFACIQCHRGDSSMTDRLQTLALGGKDTITFLMGKSDPTLEKKAIMQPALVNAACVGCHTTTLLTEKGTSTHFHNWLPQTAALIAQGQKFISSNGRNRQPRAVDTTLLCTSCHLAHQTVDPTNPKLKLVDTVTTQDACDSCHKAAGERPQNLDRLLNGGGD
jgi:hypothetical protein